jgi:hypothetical protein
MRKIEKPSDFSPSNFADMHNLLLDRDRGRVKEVLWVTVEECAQIAGAYARTMLSSSRKANDAMVEWSELFKTWEAADDTKSETER